MKKFFGKLLHFSPLLIALIATNYFVDPANLFQNGAYESGITDNLLKGYNVTNVTNYDERRLQRSFIEESNECPSVIALGASRIMILGKSASDSSFRNNGMSGASLEDYLAIVELYEEKGCHVNKILIDIEPYLLNDAHGQERWISLNKEFNTMMQKISQGDNVDRLVVLKLKAKRYLELVSPSYFKNAVQQLGKLKGRDKYLPTHEVLNTNRTILADGSIVYDAKTREIQPGEVEKGVHDLVVSNSVYSMSDFTELSPRYISMFEKFIDYLLSHNIEVEFRFFPYHPSLYRYFQENEYYHIVTKTENYFRNLAEKKGIKVVGSYDPGAYGIDNSSFYDAYHLKREELEKLK